MGGVGWVGGWVQPITKSASWQELNPKKEKLLPGTIAIPQGGPSTPPCRLKINHTLTIIVIGILSMWSVHYCQIESC